MKHRDMASVTSLLAKHASANAAEVDGTTALHWAVRSGDARLVEMLVRAGANANTANRYGVKPLSIACETGEAAIVDALLRAGADPNAPSTEGETPLMTLPHAQDVCIRSTCSSRAARTSTRRKAGGAKPP